MYSNFEPILNEAKRKKSKLLAVAAADDIHVLKAVYEALKENLIEPILIGDANAIEKICEKINFSLKGITLIDIKNASASASKAVSLVSEGKAHIVMKGNLGTSTLLKAVLDKEKGLRTGRVLSHVALLEIPNYHKLLCITDAGMNIAPTFEEKVDIINNAVEMYTKLELTNPKVAVVGAVETVNPKMEATVHASMLAQMNNRKQIQGCIVDGPFGFDNAISKEAAQQKGIISDVAGDADIIITPDIEAGNILYKALNFLGGATSAAIIQGAKVPIVLTSRADSERSKHMSIALAAAME